jgi:hypothetical protein
MEDTIEGAGAPSSLMRVAAHRAAGSFEEPAAAVYEPKYQPRRFLTGQHPADLFRWD